MMNRLKTFFTKNIGLKVISLFLGIVIWAALSNRYDPVTTKTLNIPITYLNEDKLLSEESYVVMEKPDTVQITISVRTSKKSKALPELFTCTADLCDHSGGDIDSQRVHVNVSQVSGFDTVLDWNYNKNDPNITVSLDEYIEKIFTIEVLPEDSLTEGMMLENTITFTPATVKVSGPQSSFSSLASVKAIVNYRALSEDGGGNIEEETALYLYDANDNVISNSDGRLSMDAETAVMRVTVARIQTVSLIIGGNIGTPAAGYRYVSSSVTPASISVHGLKVNVADLTELKIPAESIDITGISSDRDYVIDITPLLPEGVSLVESDGFVSVHVTVEQLETASYNVKTAAISMNGKKENFEYEITDHSVNVKIKGFREDLDVLSADSLKLSVDMSGIEEEGVHKLPVYVEDITGYTVENAGSLYVNVNVTAVETEETDETETEETSAEEESTEPAESTEKSEKESEESAEASSETEP